MKKNVSPDTAEHKKKKGGKLKWAAIAIVGWVVLGLLVTLIFGRGEREAFSIEIFAPAVQLGPLSVSICTLYGFCITAVLAILALLFRFVCMPKFELLPKGVQNVMETAVEALDKYTVSTSGRDLGEGLPAYMLTLAAYLIGCAILELFGLRSPSSDILTTFALAIVTFFLINFYGFRLKGFKGRMHHYTKPTPVIAPITLITDIAVPVSMACRLFGNMLAGLIIMELLYFALGNFASGPPAILGLYFNVFHPLIQAFIFITLSLSFIGEAVETSD